MKRYHGIIETRSKAKYFAWTDGKELLVRKDGQGAPYPVEAFADNNGHVRLFGDCGMQSTRIVEWPESLRMVKAGVYTLLAPSVEPAVIPTSTGLAGASWDF